MKKKDDKLYKIFYSSIKIISVVLVIFVVLLARDFYVRQTPARFFTENTTPKPTNLKTANNAIASIKPTTKVYYRDIYVQCKHEVLYERPNSSAGLVTLNKSQVEALFPTYVVEKFNSDEVILKRYLDEMCNECEKFVFFGVKDGYITIFYGKPRADAPVMTVTDIPIDKFPQDVQEMIKAGIIKPNSPEEINALLEGLDS